MLLFLKFPLPAFPQTITRYSFEQNYYLETITRFSNRPIKEMIQMHASV